MYKIDLIKQIVLRRGYKVIQDTDSAYELFSPDGRLLTWNYLDEDSLYSDHFLPQWTSDLTTALSLAKATHADHIDANVTIQYSNEFNIPSRYYLTWEWAGQTRVYQVDTLEELILAMCKAYLEIGPKDTK